MIIFNGCKISYPVVISGYSQASLTGCLPLSHLAITGSSLSPLVPFVPIIQNMPRPTSPKYIALATIIFHVLVPLPGIFFLPIYTWEFPASIRPRKDIASQDDSRVRNGWMWISVRTAHSHKQGARGLMWLCAVFRGFGLCRGGDIGSLGKFLKQNSALKRQRCLDLGWRGIKSQLCHLLTLWSYICCQTLVSPSLKGLMRFYLAWCRAP